MGTTTTTTTSTTTATTTTTTTTTMPTTMPEPEPGMDIHTTCDDEMKMYYDGELKPKIQAGCSLDWKITCHGFIPGTVKVLAIECKNTKAGPLGILASSRSTGLTTNAKWLCYKEPL